MGSYVFDSVIGQSNGIQMGGLIFRETEYPFTACYVSKWEGKKASHFVISSAFSVVKAAMNCTVFCVAGDGNSASGPAAEIQLLYSGVLGLLLMYI